MLDGLCEVSDVGLEMGCYSPAMSSSLTGKSQFSPRAIKHLLGVVGSIFLNTPSPGRILALQKRKMTKTLYLGDSLEGRFKPRFFVYAQCIKQGSPKNLYTHSFGSLISENTF